jgi:uncharacterized protein (DUF1697 family)
MRNVALLRGINVAGRNRLPMKDLVSLFAQAGCLDVTNYIQSGNVVFTAPAAGLNALPAVITKRIAERFGLRVPVIVRTGAELERIISRNPFPLIEAPGKFLHVYFLADLPDAKAVRDLDPERSPPDSFRVSGREIYGHFPNGIGKTKLSNAWFDSKLFTISTARNWATVLKLFEMTR